MAPRLKNSYSIDSARRITACISALALAAGLLPQALTAKEILPRVPSEEDAPIALLVDMNSGQTLFAREADRRFVPASITKAMTTFLAFEKMEQGELFAQQRFTMSDEAFRKWRRVGSTMFIGRGDALTVDQLLHGITTVSANDGSVVLAEGASGSLDNWLAEMNRKARQIGMNDSHFGSANGFPDGGRTWVTARDLVTLAETMIRRHPKKYRHFVGHKEYEYDGIKQPNHDPLIGNVAGADGIKTGFTYQAGYGYLGTAARDGRRLVMVVAGSDSGRARNRAAQEFMEWGFAAFDQRNLFNVENVVGSAKVQDGSRLSVDLVPTHRIAVSLPRGVAPEINLAIEYEGPVRAPIAKGEEIAKLRISVEGEEDGFVPLVAASEVTRASFFRRILNGFAGLFR